MKSQSARLALTDSRTPLRLAIIAALLLAGVALFSRPAIAASGTFSDCDRLATDLKSLDVPTAELPLDDADHLASGVGDSPAGLVDSDSDEAVAGAPPVLLLTPRVANIVKNVFDTLPVVAIDEGTDDTGAGDNPDDAVHSRAPATDIPPIVRAPLMPEIRLPGTRGGDTGGTQYAPRFHTPMYRTDI